MIKFALYIGILGIWFLLSDIRLTCNRINIFLQAFFTVIKRQKYFNEICLNLNFSRLPDVWYPAKILAGYLVDGYRIS